MNWEYINQPIAINFRQIATAFCNHYYATYDSDYYGLAELYTPNSCFSYQGDEVVGFDRWVNLMTNKYGYYGFRHIVYSIDAQPVGNMGLLVIVTGNLVLDNSLIGKKFTEAMLLHNDGQNRFYVYHTVFRFVE